VVRGRRRRRRHCRARAQAGRDRRQGRPHRRRAARQRHHGVLRPRCPTPASLPVGQHPHAGSRGRPYGGHDLTALAYDCPDLAARTVNQEPGGGVRRRGWLAAQPATAPCCAAQAGVVDGDQGQLGGAGRAGRAGGRAGRRGESGSRGAGGNRPGTPPLPGRRRHRHAPGVGPLGTGPTAIPSTQAASTAHHRRPHPDAGAQAGAQAGDDRAAGAQQGADARGRDEDAEGGFGCGGAVKRGGPCLDRRRRRGGGGGGGRWAALGRGDLEKERERGVFEGFLSLSLGPAEFETALRPLLPSTSLSHLHLASILAEAAFGAGRGGQGGQRGSDGLSLWTRSVRGGARPNRHCGG